MVFVCASLVLHIKSSQLPADFVSPVLNSRLLLRYIFAHNSNDCLYWLPTMRFTALIPLACAITSFVLALFCLLAGSSPGYMENYHIIAVSPAPFYMLDSADHDQLNTSTLGHNLLNATKPPSSSDPNSIGGYLSGLASNITSAIESDLTPIENNLADELAAKLGIKQWYSMHMMDLCEGVYSPNATSPDASYNATSCTNQTAMCKIVP